MWRYERVLREKHKEHAITSVLLTDSPDGSVEFRGMVHVSWKCVHTRIRAILDDGAFPAGSVTEFVRQYLSVVGRRLVPSGGGSLWALFNEHVHVLRELRQIRRTDGEDGVRTRVSEDRKTYADSIVKLVRESGQSPKEVRRAVAEHLQRRGCEKLRLTHNAHTGTYWLNWSNEKLEKTAPALDLGDSSLYWGMTFRYDRIDVGFWFYSAEPKGRGRLDQFRRLMYTMPIKTRDRREYPMRETGFGWLRVYDHVVLSGDELSQSDLSELIREVMSWLDDFMDSASSEYKLIENYFQYLAGRHTRTPH